MTESKVNTYKSNTEKIVNKLEVKTKEIQLLMSIYNELETKVCSATFADIKNYVQLKY